MSPTDWYKQGLLHAFRTVLLYRSGVQSAKQRALSVKTTGLLKKADRSGFPDIAFNFAQRLMCTDQPLLRLELPTRDLWDFLDRSASLGRPARMKLMIVILFLLLLLSSFLRFIFSIRFIRSIYDLKYKQGLCSPQICIFKHENV